MFARPGATSQPSRLFTTGSAGQFVSDAVGQLCLRSGCFEFMPVDPFCKGTLDLFVYEEAVFFVSGVEGDPMEDDDAKLDACAGLDAACLADDPNGRERRCQESESIRAFVEAEHFFYGRVDEDAFDERGHIFSLSAHEAHHRASRLPLVPIGVQTACWFSAAGRKMKDEDSIE